MSTDLMKEDIYDSKKLSSLQDILEENNFTDSIKKVQEEIDELDSLYGRLKKHTGGLLDDLDGVSETKPQRMNTQQSTRRKVSPVYIGTQITNMVSIKNLKLSLMKHIKDMEVSRLDRAFKVLNQLAKEEGSDGEIPLHVLSTFLLQNGIKAGFIMDATKPTEDDYDDILDHRFDEEGLTSIEVADINLDDFKDVALKNNLTSEKEEKPSYLYIDQEGESAYLLDDKEEIIKEFDFSSINDDDIEERDGVYFYVPEGLPIILADEEE